MPPLYDYRDLLEYGAYIVAILGGLGALASAVIGGIWWMSSLFHEVKSIRETSAVAISGIEKELAGIHAATKEGFATLGEALKEQETKIVLLGERVTKIETRLE